VSCAFAHDSAAYVLGALSPAERADYQRHLSECRTCPAHVSELAVLPGLLGRLDVAVAEMAGEPPGPAEPPPERTESEPDGLPALLEAARRSRTRDRRRRRLQTVAGVLAAACAAVVATVGVSGLTAGSPTPSPSISSGPVMRAMRDTASGIPMSAELALRPVANRTEIRMHCYYGKLREPGSARYTFRLFAVFKTGAPPQQVAVWDASFGDDMNFLTTADVRLSDMERVELRKNDGKSVVLTYDVT